MSARPQPWRQSVPEPMPDDEADNDGHLALLQLGRAVEPETHLWRAVVAQAFLDARAVGLTKEQMVHVPRARAWLLSAGRDLVDVCLLADLVPEQVVATARKMAAAKWA